MCSQKTVLTVVKLSVDKAFFTNDETFAITECNAIHHFCQFHETGLHNASDEEKPKPNYLSSGNGVNKSLFGRFFFSKLGRDEKYKKVNPI